MSDSREPKTMITSVNVESHEYLWKIHNFRFVKDNPYLRAQQKFTIETGKDHPESGLWSKWTVGLRNVAGEEGKYGVYCKLEEVTSVHSVEQLHVYFEAELRLNTGKAYWRDEHQTTVKVGDVINVRYRWIDSTDWTRFLDSGTDAITLNIILKILKPAVAVREEDKYESHFWSGCKETAEKNLLTLMELESAEFDVSIVCKEGMELKCHKCILISNSPVFEKMLQSGMSEQTSGVVNVADVGGKAMKILIQFLYTGNLSQGWKEEDVIVEFTYAADKYGLTRVLQYLDNTMGDTGSEADASGVVLLALLDLAVKLELKEAEKRIMLKIVKLTATAKSGQEMLGIFKRDD